MTSVLIENDVPNSAPIAAKEVGRARRPRQKPLSLRFLPTAWSKLLYLRDRGGTEVGGFGISHPDDLLLVEDVRLVRQSCTAVSVQFEDAAVADFFDEQIDQGRHPAQFARLWLHTHPGDSPQPSATDEETFARCFGRTDWSVMFILACGGQTYVRLQFNAGPGGSQVIPSSVDYNRSFPATDHRAWDREYDENVASSLDSQGGWRFDPWDSPDEFLDAWADYVAEEFQVHKQD